MSKPKILIFAPREEPPETINALEGMGCELVFGDRDWQLPRTTHEDAVVEAARDAVALMGTSMRHTPISRRIMQASQRLRIVAKYTVGVDDVDTQAATELGIMVCHAPTESNCFGVAETTIAFMLSLLKKVAERDADVRAGKWRTADNFAYYVGSRASDGFPGQTVGLVGLGRIGTRVAQLLAPWRARIIAYDPYVPPAHFLTHGVTSVDYQTLLRESDVVSFHVVLTPETRYMFGEAELELMKPNAIVLNTARGKVVDEKARARHRRGAHPRRCHRCLRGGATAGGLSPAQARRPRAALAPLCLLYRGRGAAAGRGLGHALGGHRAQGWHSGQCLQPGRHSALEGALWRRQRGRRVGRAGRHISAQNRRWFCLRSARPNRLIFVKNQ
jgi:D-3-phosphoglycerate dehydrogenase / 2-oxoglutarate reductase